MNLALISLPWWGYIVFTLLVTHITIIGVTIYLHRHQAHRSVDLHPIISHFFRFWLWLTTGMITWQWVAIHRKHHATVETPQDPHSPKNHGIKYFFTLLLPPALTGGVKLYRLACSKPQELEPYRHGAPDDWLERNVYAKYPSVGLFALLLLNLLVFGLLFGFIVWLVQAYWIPFWAAGVINGIGHHSGYRNYETPDASRNVVPWGIIVGGEELHNNHHAFAGSAKFSNKPWEFDIGWLYIRLLETLKLAKVKRIAPTISHSSIKNPCDLDTVMTLFNNRIQVMANFTSEVMRKVCDDESNKIRLTQPHHFKSFRKAHLLMRKESSSLDENARTRLDIILKDNATLQTVYQMKESLQHICSSRLHNSESSALKALQNWCKHAEESGVEALEQFSSRLKCYTPSY